MHDAKSCAEQIGKELIEGTHVSMIYSAHNMHLSSSQEETKEPMNMAKEAKKHMFLSEQTFFVHLSKSQNDHYGMKC